MPEDPPVRLTVPAESRYVRLARLAAAGVATEAGFDVEDVEDLRVAVNELFALLVDGAEDATDVVELSFRVRATSVEATGERHGATGEVGGPEDLALEILRVVVDEHSFQSDGRGRRFTLRKQATASR